MLGPKLKVFSLPTTFHFGTKNWENRTFKYFTKPYTQEAAEAYVQAQKHAKAEMEASKRAAAAEKALSESQARIDFDSIQYSNDSYLVLTPFQRSTFNIQCSTFTIQHSTFNI